MWGVAPSLRLRMTCCAGTVREYTSIPRVTVSFDASLYASRSPSYAFETYSAVLVDFMVTGT